MRAAAEATALDTARAAASVANDVAAAASRVAQTVAAVEAAVEDRVAATAEAQRTLAATTAAEMVIETDARAAGVAIAAREAVAAMLTAPASRGVVRRVVEPGDARAAR